MSGDNDKASKQRRSFTSSIPIKEVRDILRQVNAYPREKNKGKPFPDLDRAVEHFITAIEIHNSTVKTLHNNATLTPKNQKDFFKKLRTRLTSLTEFLEGASHEYLERLHYHQINSTPIEDRLAPKGEGLFADHNKPDPMHPQKLINTLQAYEEAAKQFEASPINQGRKDIHRDDLKQLIHFLFEVYERCSGREPRYTYGQDDKKVLRYSGDFILLVKLAKHFADLNNKDSITENSIGDILKSILKGRKSIKKQRS